MVRHPGDLMITSKLTSKAQTTIPSPVRRALNLRPGDDLAYAVTPEGLVILTRAVPAADIDPFATFDEWASAEDMEAYASL